MQARVMAVAYALCVAALMLGISWQPLPPCVDYPQHLALASQTRELLLGHGAGRLVPWTYNGLFEFSVAALGLLLPIELAGRAVLAAALALVPFSVWQLVRFHGRPRVYAFAWFPFAYSLCLSWGFINYVLSVSLATLALIAWFEKRSTVLFVALSLLTALAHLLGASMLIAGAGVGALTKTRAPRALLQLIPVVGFVALAHAATDPSPQLSHAADFLYNSWLQRLRLGDALLGSWHGPADEWLAVATGLVLALTPMLAARGAAPQHWRRPREAFAWLTLAASGLYALGPLVFFGCWFFYQRAGYVAALWLPAVLPRIPAPRWATAQAGALLLLAVSATANFFVHGLREGEASDALAIIDAIPRAARVAPVLEPSRGHSTDDALGGPPVSDEAVWGHFPAYAVVRRNAEVPYLFAREFGHFPVRQTSPFQRGLPQVEFSWFREFDPAANYARDFDHILVRSADADPGHDPKPALFGESAVAGRAVTVAHHGRFWLYRASFADP